jgi:putative ABC transport system substrate-binding protein
LLCGFFSGFEPVSAEAQPASGRPGSQISDQRDGRCRPWPRYHREALSVDETIGALGGLIAALAGPLSGSTGQFGQIETRDLNSAAGVLGVQVTIVNFEMKGQIAPAIETFVTQKTGALLIGANIGLQQAREQIIALAAQHKMPTMFWDSASASAGALSSYGPDFVSAYHQAGLYVGRIPRGEKPADLPVVQPTKFSLVINLKTAKALGLTTPETLLATADEVIQ